MTQSQEPSVFSCLMQNSNICDHTNCSIADANCVTCISTILPCHSRRHKWSLINYAAKGKRPTRKCNAHLCFPRAAILTCGMSSLENSPLLDRTQGKASNSLSPTIFLQCLCHIYINLYKMEEVAEMADGVAELLKTFWGNCLPDIFLLVRELRVQNYAFMVGSNFQILNSMKTPA